MRAKLNVYDDWIQERAGEIAEEHGKDFYNLSAETQIEISKQAHHDYIDAYEKFVRPYISRIRKEIVK